MRHYTTTLLALLLIAYSAQAQKPRVENDPTHDDKPVHFGFSLGVNASDYRIKPAEEYLQSGTNVGVGKLMPGINIHAIMNVRLAENWDLRLLPGISFGDRDIHYRNVHLNTDSIISLASSYLEMPVTFKYKSKRLNNFRPYLLGGTNFRYDLAAKQEYNPEDQPIILKRPDLYLELGYGMDFYLTYFKFAVELKYSFGLSDLLLRTDRKGNTDPALAFYTNSIDKLASHIFVLSFHFE